ncbi:MAG TPA: hypothetical protein VFG68_22770, partial [Fimbriiglobus sp.]|nr:hypothetical protein [Fimbriiglobus sp.]
PTGVARAAGTAAVPGMSRTLLGWPAFLAVALAAQGWVVVADLRRDAELGRDVPGFLFGDSGVYAAAADSLLRDRDLDLLNQCFPGRTTLADVLPELEGEHGGEFGLSKDGRLTIKQSPVLSAAALPFYALFGRPGLLIFNLAALNLFLIGLAKLAGDTPAARVAVLVGFLATPLLWYSANFSPDLFLCALLVGSLLAARADRPTLAGVLAGLAVSVKVYVAAMVLPIPVLVWATAGDRRWVALVRFAAGGLLGLAPGLAFNTWLFGAPWVTGYERQLLVRDGAIGLADHSSRFTIPFAEGLRNLLFEPAVGLWPTAPLWSLWPVAVCVLLIAPVRGRAWVLTTAAVILLNLAVFAPYDGWNGSAVGNRYVFPALGLGFALIGAAISAVVRAAPTPDPAASADGAACRGRAEHVAPS